jgi:zinc transporter ZupT
MIVGFVGSGNMAAAIARGWKGEFERMLFSDSGSGRAQALADELGGEAVSNAEIAERADLVVLAVKPNKLDEVAPGLSEAREVVSVLAVVPLGRLRAAFPSAEHVLRAMPNVGVEVRQGVLCVAGSAGAETRAKLDLLGHVVEIPDEDFDEATAIMGCAPAYLALAVEALAEAFELQAVLPSALGGAGLVLLGVALSYLTLTFVSHRLSSTEGGGSAALGGIALATLVAIGIGLHNFGEGLAIGTSFALGELALGTFLIVGFMIHNVTEGLGIAAPLAEGKRAASVARLAALVVIAGAPAILGAWLGGFVRSDVLGAVFFAAAAGAALEVVVEVGRFVARRAPGGLSSGYVLGGFLSGVAVMYVTGLVAG